MSRTWKHILGTGILFLCLFLLAAAYFFEIEESTLDVCLIHRLTGLDCPGCGMTRAFHCLLHLRFADALDYNIFSPVMFLLIGAGVALTEGYLFFDYKLRARIPAWPFVALLIALLVFGVVRNIPVQPFLYLHT